MMTLMYAQRLQNFALMLQNEMFYKIHIQLQYI